MQKETYTYEEREKCGLLKVIKFFLVVLSMSFTITLNGQVTWYTLASGKWTDPNIWTLDPAGAVPINPSALYPNLTTDNIVVRTGITVAIPDGLSPYDSPLEIKNNLNCAVLTVNGDLDFGVSSGHQFSQIKGNGRLYFESNNFPSGNWANFITEGQGGGTIVLRGTGFSVTTLPATVYDLEINDPVGNNTYILNQNLTIGGKLNVIKGTFQINGTGTTVRNLTVNGNVTIQTNGRLTTGTASGAVSHWMNVYGDFTNNGQVDFTNSNQYVEANNGAVKLRFLGSTDNNLVCNNTTDLYRLFVDKGTDQTYTLAVNANASANFKLFAPVGGASTDAADGAAGWQRLPIVISNGTLKLESNILISRLGENKTGNAPNEFTIPETGCLWVNGGVVTSGNSGNSWSQNWNGITVYGSLRVSLGSVTTPQYSSGISYDTPVNQPGELLIEGGNVNVTQLVQRTSGATFVYRQTGGNLNLNAVAEQNWNNPTFELPETNSVFEMSGGNIVFDVINSPGNVDALKIGVGVGNYDVIGGTIEIKAPTLYDGSQPNFDISSTAPFYNLLLSNSGRAGTQPVELYRDLEVLNDVTVNNGVDFRALTYKLSIGGDFTINSGGAFSQTASSAAQLVFYSAQNSILTNGNSSALSITDLVINKEIFAPSTQFYTLTLAGSTGGVTINDSLLVKRGKLDVVNYNINLKKNIEITDGDLTSSGSGSIILSGTTLQTLKGAVGVEQNFGRLQLNNTTGSTPQIKLLSNINATSVTFLRNQVFDTDIFNLDIATANYTSIPFSGGSWGTSCMFKTSGKVSDGGLSLPIVLNANYGANTNVQCFPIGTFDTQGGSTLQFNPAYVDATGTLNSSGSITVKPSNSNHPTVSDASKVIPYYWKVAYSGLAGITATNLRYRFTYSGTIPASVNKGVILNSYAWNEYNSAVSGSTVTFPYGSFLTVDFSIGNKSAFNKPDVLYSKASGNFNAASTWTLSSTHSGSDAHAPTAYDFCIVGGVAGTNHTVTISANNADASQVYIKGNSETGNSGTPPSLVVSSGTSGHDIDIIDGKGRLAFIDNTGAWEIASANLINGDYSSFCNNSEAIFEYAGTNGYRIAPLSKIPFYPNLYISGNGTNTKYSRNDGNLIVKGNLYINDGLFAIDSYYNGMVTVAGNLNVNTGTLTLSNQSTQNTYVEGAVVFSGAGTLKCGDSGSENMLYVKGAVTLVNGSILDFSSNNRKTNIVFYGNNSATVSRTGSGTTNLYRVYINKPVGQRVLFSTAFTLGGPTNDVNKSLVLQSGECSLSNSSIDLTISSANNPYKIPSGTILRVDNGSLTRVGGSVANTGIWLDGALIVDNGGKVYCNQGSGSYLDNYIEYTPSGNASIWLGTNAELLVGSQLRRTTTSDQGVLSFTQSKASSLVTLGSLSAPTNNRGVFEILNSSSFVQSETGCNITLVRAQTAPSAPTLNFNPATSNIASGCTFTLGNASTPASQNFWLYAGQPLMNLTIGSTNTPTVTVKTAGLTADGNLTNGGTLNANGYDLTIKGNFINNGTYTPVGNTTYFSGSSDQSISGTALTTTFFDLTKQSSTTLSLAGATTVSVTNDLTLEGGILNTGNFDLNVGRNIASDGTTLSSGASKGVVCNGGALQQLSGLATFARLTIDNANGLDVPTQASPINFTESLNLDNGVMNIGRNLIVFDNDAVINAASGFSSSRMVQTNLSFTDNGIKKVLPSGASTFLFPIGSGGKYTPVSLTVTANGNNTGAVRIKAANERHVSIQDDPTTLALNETQNVLQYNWTLDATGIAGFTGSALMTFVNGDALVTAPNDTSQYITARILLSGNSWNKFDAKDFNGSAKTLRFAFSGTDDTGIDGDYTAGIDACIPNVIPAYISVVDGPWTTTSTWATYNETTHAIGSPGVGVPTGGPRGTMVYIDKTVTMPSNFMAAYRTYINANGVLLTGTSIGHRLGDVNGSGVLQLQTGTLPAGVYDDFLSATGGTLDFTGTGLDYSILSEVTSLNNLKLSGTGNRSFPNIGFTILGDLTIAGANCLNPHNTNYSVQGDILFNSGSYDPNTATVTLNGTSRQSVSGTLSFTGSNDFYDLVMNNNAGVDIYNNVEVANVLTLTNGIMNTGAGGSLTLTNSLPTAFAGGSTTAYVDGPLRKQINNSSYFEFPVGDNSRYGRIYALTNGSSQGIWEAEYVNHNPNDDGYDPASLSGVAYVSHNEYWRVKAPVSGNSATLKLYWDSSSGVNPDVNFKVVRWTDLATDAWQGMTIDSPSGDASSGNVSLSSPLPFGFSASNNNHYLTFGSATIPAYSWVGGTSTDWFTTGNWSGNSVPSAGSNITINNVVNDPVIGEGIIAQTNDIVMASGAVLTLSPGARMTVNGAITNTGATILVKNTVAKPTSLLAYGNLSGPVSVEWVYPTGRYFYVGHSVDGQTFSGYQALTPDPYMFRYSAAWSEITSAAYNFDTNKLEGYSVKFNGIPDATMALSGNLRVGSYGPMAINGWHLIGNPYSTYLDLESTGLSLGNALTTIWTTTNASGSAVYATYNISTHVGANGGTRYVAPGQAFWVRNYSASNLSINKSVRTHAIGSLKAASTLDDVLRLTLSKGNTADEAVVVFRSIGNETYSAVYDSEKRFTTGTSEVSLYTQKDSRKLIINVLPDENLARRIVPLYLNVGSANVGTFKMSATNLSEFMPDIDVYLLDKTTGETVNLREKSEYTFTTAAVSAQNRFELSFVPKPVVEVPTDIANGQTDGIRITALGLGNKAIVKVIDAAFVGKVTIEVMDALGKLHGSTVSETARTEVGAPSNTQFYIVKVTYRNKVQTFKIVTAMD